MVTKKIIDVRAEIKRNGGVVGYEAPYLAIAALCERVLIDKADDVISLMRIVDIFQFTAPDNIDPQKPIAVLVNVFFSFAEGLTHLPPS
jgi:hypothetical protein